MSEIAEQVTNNEPVTRFRATLGDKCAEGRTRGEALDRLFAGWENAPLDADVRIEAMAAAAPEEYEPYHLENRGGWWVIAGGPPMSPEDANRDWVREMRDERIRSFFPPEMRDAILDDDYA